MPKDLLFKISVKIGNEALRKSVAKLSKNSYGDYLLYLLNEDEQGASGYQHTPVIQAEAMS